MFWSSEMNVTNLKTIAILGSIFIFVYIVLSIISSFLSNYLPALGILFIIEIAFLIAGFVLMLVALKIMSNMLRVQKIFNYYLAFVIVWFVAIFVVLLYFPITSFFADQFVEELIIKVSWWVLPVVSGNTNRRFKLSNILGKQHLDIH